MTAITIKQLAYRISTKINSVQRTDRDHGKGDFVVGTPLPGVIYNEFVSEFPKYSQKEINEFTLELTKFVEE